MHFNEIENYSLKIIVVFSLFMYLSCTKAIYLIAPIQKCNILAPITYSFANCMHQPHDTERYFVSRNPEMGKTIQQQRVWYTHPQPADRTRTSL